MGSSITRRLATLSVFAVLFSMLLVAPCGPSLGQTVQVPLSSAQRAAIRRAPHPYLRRVCPSGVSVIAAYRIRAVSRHLVVAQVGCRQASSGSPIETAVYRPRGRHLRQVYRLDEGGTVQRGRFSIAADGGLRTHAHRVVMGYAGYRDTDAVCCPSRTYHRVFTLTTSTFHKGALVRNSGI